MTEKNTSGPKKSPSYKFSRFSLNLFSRFRISPVQITFAFSIIIGVVAALGAYVFSYLIHLVEGLCCMEGVSEAFSIGPWLILLPAIGGLLAGPLIYLFAREAKGHGVPEVMAAVIRDGGRIRPVVAIVKSIASALTIGTGGSAGSEGPIVQIGAGFGSTLGQIFRMPPRRINTFVACGAAGGISAIFNAPFGGIMFSLEVILGEFRGLSFIYVAIASVVSALVSRALTGDETIFAIEKLKAVLSMSSPWEIFSFIGLGVFVASVSKTFNFVLESFEDFYEKLKFPEWLKPATGGLAVGLLAYYATRIIPTQGLNNPLSVLSVGYYTIRQILNPEHYATWLTSDGIWVLVLSLALLAVYKILATSFTLGSGGSGGIFAPSLFTGAMAGGLYGIILHSIFPGHTASPAVYALVGMGACFAGAAHAPITAIFILFEMSDSYEIILPIMASVVVSTLVAHWIKPESIYTAKLIQKGIELTKKDKSNILQSMVIKDVMIREVQSIPETMTMEVLRKKVGTTLHTSLPVVDVNDDLVGIITYKELHLGVEDTTPDSELTARDFMKPDPVTAYPDEPVDQVFKRMKSGAIGIAPVIKSEKVRKVVGIVTYSNIFEAYEKALLD
ncbi:MAG: chloride channel protein [Candidatus Auribacterota bacterium]|nr:chloride channel protein [Candidatus Auribacterota bacterium]